MNFTNISLQSTVLILRYSMNYSLTKKEKDKNFSENGEVDSMLLAKL